MIFKGTDGIVKTLVVVVVHEVPNVVELTVTVGITLSTLELFRLKPKELL